MLSTSCASGNGVASTRSKSNKSSSVTFLPSSQTSPAHGFTLAFPALTLHALTPASADGSVPAHVYCQIDETQHAANGNGNGEVEDDGEDWQMREVRIYVDAAEGMSHLHQWQMTSESYLYPHARVQVRTSRECPLPTSCLIKKLTFSRAPIQRPLRLLRSTRLSPPQWTNQLVPLFRRRRR